MRIQGDQTEPPTPRDIRGYVAEIHGQQVHYRHKDDIEREAPPAFVDRGREIDIYHWRNRDCILAALQLAAQKWGTFKVTGNDEFINQCVSLAAEHGFKISNPELQERIEEEQQQIRQDRARLQKSEPSQLHHHSPTIMRSAIEAYQLFYQDIVQRQKGGEIDLFKVDAMIAVRLRVTGHTKIEIEQTLRQCAPSMRPQGESQDWADYVNRTVRYAFGIEGDRQMASLSKDRALWEQLEGRTSILTPIAEKRQSPPESDVLDM